MNDRSEIVQLEGHVMNLTAEMRSFTRRQDVGFDPGDRSYAGTLEVNLSTLARRVEDLRALLKKQYGL